jgi:hypothetical protein
MAPWCGRSVAPNSKSSALASSAKPLGAGGVELDGRHVAPELLEAVVIPRLGREDVQDDVEVVREDPVPLSLALDGSRPQLVIALQALPDLVRDRLGLSRIAPVAQDEEVRVDADRPQVEDDDVLRQLLLGEAGNEASLIERGQSERVLSRLPNLILASALGIQPTANDLARHRRRHEAVDRLSGRQKLPDLTRRDRMLLDPEDLNVAFWNGLTGPRGYGNWDQSQDLLRLLPGVERLPLVGADHEHRVLELLVAKEIDRVRMRIRSHLHAGHVRKGQAGELEPGPGVQHRRLVAGALGDQHEHPIDAELAQRSLGERDVTQVRRIERSAEKRRPQSVTVSSPISTSAPGFAPTARSASSSASRSGGFPTTRNPRSVRKMR